MIGILPILVQRNSLFTWKCSHRHFLIEILRKDSIDLIPKSHIHNPCSKCVRPVVVLIILKITIVKHKSFIMKTRMIEIMEHGTKMFVVSVDKIHLIMNPKIEYYTNHKCEKIYKHNLNKPYNVEFNFNHKFYSTFLNLLMS